MGYFGKESTIKFMTSNQSFPLPTVDGMVDNVSNHVLVYRLCKTLFWNQNANDKA